MEVRKIMLYATHAGRIRRGVLISFTVSPDEKHNTIMLRLSRVRRKDPVNSLDATATAFGGLKTLSIASANSALLTDEESDIIMDIPLEDLLKKLPTYDERRAILARDGLASVDGFKLTILLVCEHILGMRVCFDCPACSEAKE